MTVKTVIRRAFPVILALFLCISCGCTRQSEQLSADDTDSLTEAVSGNVSDDAGSTEAKQDAASSGTAQAESSGKTASSVSSKTPATGEATGSIRTDVVRKNGKRQPDKDTPELKAMKDKLDFGGKELVIMFEWQPVTQIGYGHGASTDSKIKRFEELQEKYNVKLTLKQCATKPFNTAVITSIMSGHPSANIYMVGTNFLYAAVRANLCADMTDAMNETGITMDASYYYPLSTQIGNVNGRQYEMGAGQRIGGYIAYNKTVLNGLKLEDPHQLIKDKKWTWAKLTEMAERATLRDKNGAIRRYGLGMSLYNENFTAMVLSNGGRIIEVDGKGKMVNNLDSLPVRQAMDQIYQWGQKKILTINYGQVAWQALDEDFHAGKIAFLYAQSNTVERAIYDMKDDFGIAYLPMGPNAKDYVSFIYDDYGYIVPINYQKQIRDYLLLLDDLVKPRTKDDFRTDWISMFQTKEDYLTFKAMYDGTITRKFDNGHWFGMRDLCGLADGTRTTSQIIGQYKNEITNGIKDNFGNMTFARYTN